MVNYCICGLKKENNTCHRCSLLCPNCKNNDPIKFSFCDNDCGTVVCDNCKLQIFQGKIGHRESCGYSTDFSD